MSEIAKTIIKDHAVVADAWRLAAADTAADTAAAAEGRIAPADRLILPLAIWLEKVGAGGTAMSALPGVLLAPEDDLAPLVEALGGKLDSVPLIAVSFPKFVEGRGYSTAYLLRQRYGYRGELRAVGDLGRDNIWPLSRVGFNSFDLRTGTDLHDALQAFDDFPERYQSSIDQSLPLFRRRDVMEAPHD